MDCIIHGVTKSQTQLSDFHLIFLNSSHCLLFKAPPHLIFPNSVNDTITVLSSKILVLGLPSWSSGWNSMLSLQGQGLDPFSGNRNPAYYRAKKKKKSLVLFSFSPFSWYLSWSWCSEEPASLLYLVHSLRIFIPTPAAFVQALPFSYLLHWNSHWFPVIISILDASPTQLLEFSSSYSATIIPSEEEYSVSSAWRVEFKTHFISL